MKLSRRTFLGMTAATAATRLSERATLAFATNGTIHIRRNYMVFGVDVDTSNHTAARLNARNPTFGVPVTVCTNASRASGIDLVTRVRLAAGAVTLTAGEHDIVMTWFQTSGDNLCRLYWSGPVGGREIIQSSQLVPVPSALPEGWVGARTFNGVASANNPGDVRFNANGTIDLAYGGKDLYGSENGYNFLWQPVKGDFTCVTRVDFTPPTLLSGSMAQKGGLMVRSALDAAAPFEACVIKMDAGHLMIGGKRCTARGSQPKDGGKYLDGANGWTERVSDNDTGCWLRLRREGNTITYAYRKDNGGVWKDVYSFDVSPDVYGETVYVGLTSTAYIGYEYSRTPTYDWRFSHARVGPIPSIKLFFR